MTARVSSSRRFVLAFVVASLAAAAWLPAQQAALSPAEQQRRKDLERELQSIAVVERKVMMPMRDGVRLATDIYRPKDASRPGAGRVLEDAVQLQLLGRAQPRAGRHVARR